MWRHYLTTAYKVLLRRKFFTFVNIFGTAITLGVLTLVIAMLDNYLEPRGAESNGDHILIAKTAMLTTTDGSSTWTSNLGFRFIERLIWPMQTPDLVGFVEQVPPTTLFVDGQKISPAMRHTDANYWTITQHDVIAGRTISADDVAEGRFVAVLNDTMARQIFAGADPIGQSLLLGDRRFEVIGTVADEPETRMYSYGEIWLPYTTNKSQSYRTEWLGSYTALLYVEDPARKPLVQEELQDQLAKFVHDDPEQFQVAKSTADTRLEVITRDFTNSRFEADSGASVFITSFAVAMLAFMLLPAINLTNLNTSRIMERAGEIGVRKAFGASVMELVKQFLIENLVLTIVGGIVGLVLGIGLLMLLETSGMIAYADFRLNWTVFVGAFGLMIVFGLFSGIYPAFKMARMQPVQALKGGR